MPGLSCSVGILSSQWCSANELIQFGQPRRHHIWFTGVFDSPNMASTNTYDEALESSASIIHMLYGKIRVQAAF
jgi:hypothetical protein